MLQNAARNYQLSPPAGKWVQADPPPQASDADLAFRNDAENAWIIIASFDCDADDSSATALADDLRIWLENGMRRVDKFEASADRLDRMAAQRARLEGEQDGQTYIRIGLTAAAHGIGYRLAVWTTKARSESPARDFSDLAASFRLLSDQPPHKNAARILSNLTEFRSAKFGYLLRAPRNAWRENPDLPVSSRFADLKLMDRSRNAHIVVSPRQTSNLTAFVDAYIARIQRENDSAGVQVLRIDRRVKISGLDAQRVLLNVNDATGPFQLGCTMIECRGWIYQIECRAPTDRWRNFEPAFNDIVSSFEIFAQPTTASFEAGSTEPKADETTSPKTTVPAKGDSGASSPVEKTPGDAEKSGLGEKPDGALKKADSKASEKAKTSKRKSLDDLD